MEVGAVKQAFNNELILLKKNLNQAKIQIIHKLTRKAKTLAEKKAPENLKEKLKRKAESAVKEVLIIKKLKVKEVGRFIVTHTGELKGYLNRPKVDNDKACARILLHKAMQQKYTFIRDRFSKVPIKDLFMSRQERLKIKKEARLQKQNKRKGKENNKVVNSEGDWDVEDVEMGETSKEVGDDDNENGDDLTSDDGEHVEVESDHSDEDGTQNEVTLNRYVKPTDSETDNEEISDCINGNEEESRDKFVKEKLPIIEKKPVSENANEIKIASKPILPKHKEMKRPEKKVKENKNKNLHEKLLSRKFKKDKEEAQVEQNKIVDPFFKTATGENYMSLAEPRQPDEFKEIHRQGNRKLRRAVMFGLVPKVKPRQDFRQENKFHKQNGVDKNYRFENKDRNNFNDRKPNFNDRKTQFYDRNKGNEGGDVKEEKLHPSWEAKKKQSGILPFQGKKIVFDES